MESGDKNLSLTLSEAIFAVADVNAAIRFYRDVLGFQSEWTWGETPDFGGVRWGKIHVMFCLQPELARKVEGHQHALYCDDIDGLYAQHQSASAPIISEVENKPWGIREYVVRDLNGYHVRFGGPATYERPANAIDTLPEYIEIRERLATTVEYGALHEGIDWSRNDTTMEQALRNSLYGVVAIDTRGPGEGTVVGALRIVGDGVKVFYVQDVIVLPEFQHQRIGSAMMEVTMAWLRRTAPKGASVGLFTGKPEFYEQFGFQTGYGMSLGL